MSKLVSLSSSVTREAASAMESGLTRSKTALDFVRGLEIPVSASAIRHTIRQTILGDGAVMQDSTASTVFSTEVAESDRDESKRVQIERWRAFFKKIADENGGLTIDTFRLLLKVVQDGLEPVPADLRARFVAADVDGSGRISFARFMHGAESSQVSGVLVTIHPTTLATIQAAATLGDKRIALEAKRLLEVVRDVNRAILPATLRTLGAMHIEIEAGFSVYATVGEMGERLAHATSVRARLDRLPEKAQLGLSLTASLPKMAAPRSERPASRRAQLASWLPSEHEAELCVTFAQYTALNYALLIAYRLALQKDDAARVVDASFLRNWEEVVGWMALSNIDLESFSRWASAVTLASLSEAAGSEAYTSVYVGVTAGIPLVVSFGLLASFLETYKVIWCFCIALGLASSFASVILFNIVDGERLRVNSQGGLDKPRLGQLLGVSLGFVALLLAALMLWRLSGFVAENRGLRGRIADLEVGGKKAAAGKAQQAQQPNKQPALKVESVVLRAALRGDARTGGELLSLLSQGWRVHARNLALASALLIFAQQDEFTADETSLFRLDVPLRVLLTFVACAVFIFEALSLSERGRALIRLGWELYELHAVPVLGVSLSLLLVPVTQLALGVWYSERVSCRAGSRFPVFALSRSAVAPEGWSSRDVECELCDFAAYASAPRPAEWSGALATAAQCSARLCAASASRHSPHDVRLSYPELLRPFFGPASLLTLLAFMVGVPLFLLRLVRRHGHLIDRGYGAKEAAARATPTERAAAELLWRFRMECIRIRVPAPYSEFKLRFRQLACAQACTKAVLVVLTVFFAAQPVAGSALIAAVHLTLVVLWLLARPQVSVRANGLATTLAVASAFNSLVIPMVENGTLAGMTAESARGLVVFFNFVLPLAGYLALLLPDVRLRRRLLLQTDRIEADFTLAQVAEAEKSIRSLSQELDELTRSAIVLELVPVLTLVGFAVVALIMIAQVVQVADSSVLATTRFSLGRSLNSSATPLCLAEDQVAATEFAFYQSWVDFASNCCCAERQTAGAYGDEAQVGVTELWSCLNGIYKERSRVDDRSIRGFCSPLFNAGFSLPVFDPATFRMATVGPAGKLHYSGQGW